MSYSRCRPFAILWLLLCLFFSPNALLASELRIASWNIQNLGWGQNKSYPALARVASQFDILAIQELMNVEAIETLRDRLSDKTGVEWQTLYSHRIGRSSYREKYAFLWRSDMVEYIDGAVVYLDNADLFAREPFSARFAARASGEDFVLATVHITYGRRVSDRTPEIQALAEYWRWLAEVYPETSTRRILLGDFNLRPSHPAWAALNELARPLIIEGATTLSSHDRRYANLYDNIWLPHDSELNIRHAGILEFPVLLTDTSGRHWSHEKARRHVSDHAPVYLLLGEARLYSTRSGELHVPNREQRAPVFAAPAPEAACIDLNTSSQAELAAIIHIGEARAAQIIQGRPWSSLNALRRIPGLGPARISDIQTQGRICE